MKKTLLLLFPLLMSASATAADSAPAQQKTVLRSAHGGTCATAAGQPSKECAQDSGSRR